jgi:hypothetical protein
MPKLYWAGPKTACKYEIVFVSSMLQQLIRFTQIL